MICRSVAGRYCKRPIAGRYCKRPSMPLEAPYRRASCAAPGGAMRGPSCTPDSTPMKKVRNTRLTNVCTLRQGNASGGAA